MSRELRDPVNRPEKGEREEQGAVATFGMWQDRNSESYVRREGARACSAVPPLCLNAGGRACWQSRTCGGRSITAAGPRLAMN